MSKIAFSSLREDNLESITEIYSNAYIEKSCLLRQLQTVDKVGIGAKLHTNFSTFIK